MRYVPFLKFKGNEVGALKELPPFIKSKIIPFFDIPRDDELTSVTLNKKVCTAYRKYELHMQDLPAFYLDNYDIDDSIKISGHNNYKFIIDVFSKSSFIPVIGLDRSAERIRCVFESRDAGEISSDVIAIRLTEADFISWRFIQDDIETLMNDCVRYFSNVHLIIDNRVCSSVSASSRAEKITLLINELVSRYHFEYIICTGSIIPASISDLIGTGKVGFFQRNELNIYNLLKNAHPAIVFGDYTVVSPLYSDVNIPKEVLQKIMAPKILYSFDDQLHISRGHALESHPRGAKQYNDMAIDLVSKAFFRKAPYSWGDNFIVDKSLMRGKNVTPNSIIKPLVNAHITFVFNTI